MMSSGHLPLFIRKGCSHVRAEVWQPRSQGVCLYDAVLGDVGHCGELRKWYKT